MAGDTPQTIHLKDYTPPPFLIEQVDLRFQLDETATKVHSTLVVRRNPAGQPVAHLRLDGQALRLLAVALDGHDLGPNDYRLDDESLTLLDVPDAFTLEVDTEINPKGNTALEGLYLSSGNFCTQCEAEGFRRITYYLDRPDAMARFTTRVEADKARYPLLLSNGNPVASGELENGRHFVTWEDPFPKPCYLFALVAGDLALHEDTFTTMSGREVALRLYVEHRNIDQCAHAMRSLKRAMKWDEETFGREYDLDIYMIVAVSDFNMGAMENKGLNVFNAKYVLARPETATDHEYQWIEGVIGHEYFHNWSGNRVTCRDWFQLSLKEGFTVFRDQEFSADMGSRAVKRIQDVRDLRARQFPEDGGPMAHPVRPESYIEINNFYTATVYEKGAEVVRMLHTLLGGEAFRKGSDLYFERHDGQAVTVEDFVAAMERASGRDLASFRRWYSQAGTPVVSAERHYDAAAQRFTLTLRQHTPPTPGQPEKGPLVIPLAMGLIGADDGRPLPLQLEGEAAPVGDHRVLEFSAAEQTFTFVGVTQAPIPSLLRGFSAPVKLEAGYSDPELAFLMAFDGDEFNRWEAGQQLAAKVILGLVADHQAGRSLGLDETLSTAFGELLADREVDPALLAEALALPDEGYLAELMTVVDPDALFAARQHLRRTLAAAHRERLTALYRELSGDAFSIEGEAMGRRALKNVALGYLGELADEETVALCAAQFRRADNMTDSMAALRALSHLDRPEREVALAAFYERWQEDPLVLDKWFSLQAVSRLPGTLDEVKRLMGHPAFSIRNPNKVRSLIGAFCAANPVRFHAAAGEGYRFLADRVIELNALNPQVAARLLTPLTRWRRFDAARQGKMRDELMRIRDSGGLAKDVYEVVSKSLEG
ncbi:aminopeptidase N [Endothiovibrio diazotrophicus]